MRKINLISVAVLAFELASGAPAAAQSDSKSASQTIVSSQSLAGKKVYVYDFLDIRKEEYTPKVLDQIEGQLNTLLTQHNISSTLIRFRNTADGQFYADNSTSSVIPVQQIVEHNFSKEEEFSADYRLIVFPSRYEVFGAWRYYNIRWVVMDAYSGKSVFEYEYSGRHLVMWSNGENSESRGRKIIDALSQELSKAGLI
jgi:hypothetical protein